MLDAEGHPANDPQVLVGGGGGSIRPFGGDANEHKGFALALMIEALSACLSGGGRAMAEESDKAPGSSAFIQIINPDIFAGRTAFEKEMETLVRSLSDTPRRPGSSGARVPGQRAYACRREQMDQGLALHPTIRPHIEPMAERYGLRFPDPLG